MFSLDKNYPNTLFQASLSGMLRNVLLLLNLWNSSNNNSSNNSNNNSNRLPEEESWNNSPACSSAPLLPLLKRLENIQPIGNINQVL
jgi:hypothetical protein